jgi:nucleoid-associated protein EbfC
MLPDDPAQPPGSDEAYDPSPMGGMPDLQFLLSQASAMQERLVAAQHELDEARFEGTSGGGLVHATVTGTGELIGLTLDPSVCDPDDPETLGDLVVAAVRNAVDTAHESASATMGELSGGFGGALGADLSASLGLGSGTASDPGPSSGARAGFVMPLDDDRWDPEE